MVQLDDDRDPLALEALHQRHLPQGFRAVEQRREEAADERVEIRGLARPAEDVT